MADRAASDPPRRGFSLTELLVVIGVIAILLALLAPVLRGAMVTARMTEAAGNMRRIGVMMGVYSADARDCIVPSRFNHRQAAYPGRARSAASIDEAWHLRGTWADILWTRNELGVFPEAGLVLGDDYRYDSPDERLYDLVGVMENPLRSPVGNTIDVTGGDIALPYGNGALERADPGFFAANSFFDDDEESPTYNPDGPFTNALIRHPERSMYLVDSFAGEVIDASHFCDVEEHT